MFSGPHEGSEFIWHERTCTVGNSQDDDLCLFSEEPARLQLNRQGKKRISLEPLSGQVWTGQIQVTKKTPLEFYELFRIGEHELAAGDSDEEWPELIRRTAEHPPAKSGGLRGAMQTIGRIWILILTICAVLLVAGSTLVAWQIKNQPIRNRLEEFLLSHRERVRYKTYGEGDELKLLALVFAKNDRRWLIEQLDRRFPTLPAYRVLDAQMMRAEIERALRMEGFQHLSAEVPSLAAVSIGGWTERGGGTREDIVQQIRETFPIMDRIDPARVKSAEEIAKFMDQKLAEFGFEQTLGYDLGPRFELSLSGELPEEERLHYAELTGLVRSFLQPPMILETRGVIFHDDAGILRGKFWPAFEAVVIQGNLRFIDLRDGTRIFEEDRFLEYYTLKQIKEDGVVALIGARLVQVKYPSILPP